MPRREISNLLAQIVALQAQRGSLPTMGQVQGLSQGILSSVPVQNPYTTEPVAREDVRGPSFINRVLDVLSRPLYASANFVRGNVERAAGELPQGTAQERLAAVPGAFLKGFSQPGEKLEDIWMGLSGREKTMGRDILEVSGTTAELEGKPGAGPSLAAAGLGLDILMDPLTFVGTGPLRALLGRAAKRSTEALAQVERGTGEAAQGIAEELSRRAANQANKLKFTAPEMGAPAPPPGTGPRTFMAGPGPTGRTMPTTEPFTGLPGPRRLELPRGAPENFVPLDANAISFIKQSVARGVPLHQAALRPLYNIEAPVLQEGIAAGKTSRQLEQELARATGHAPPQSPFGRPPVANQIDEDSIRKIEELQGQRDLINQRMDELEDALDDALPEDSLTLNQELTRLEAQGRDIGQQIENLRRTPESPTITSPTPRPAEPVEIVKEALQKSTAGRSELKRIETQLPTDVDPLTALRIFQGRVGATKSPVLKNILNQQIRKLQEGVRPADLLGEARIRPPDFPAITINERWQESARLAAENFLKSNTQRNINHVGQSNLFNRVTAAARKVRADRRANAVFQMLRVAEDQILAAGRHLVDAEGISVRLSDLANIAGGPRALTSRLVDDFRNARPSQRLEDLKAFTTPQVASEILDPVIKAAENVRQTTTHLPPSRTVQLGSDVSKALTEIAERAGASSREAGAAKKFIDDIFNPSRDKLYSAIQQEARALVRQSASGVVDQKMLHRISNAVYEQLGANPRYLGRLPIQNKVVEAIMTRVATWFGAKDLRPFAREYIDSARNIASAFEHALTPIVRSTTPSQRTNAWRIAQGRMSAGSPQEQALADKFKYLMERLMGTHGITQNAEAVVLRSGTLMKELNKSLPDGMQFIDKTGIDDIGRNFDYSDGAWMHSWKEWTGTEPAEILYRLTRALQLVTRKNAMWDDAASRWAMPVKGAEFQHTVPGIERLDGMYFPQQIAEQLNNLNKQLERDVFKSGGKFLQLIDKIQRMWKTGVTIYSPSHHIRNLNGDIFLAALDGVTSPTPYMMSTRVLHAMGRNRYRDLESVLNIMDPKLRDAALTARPGRVILTTARGDRLTAEQIYQAAESQGFLLRAVQIEDLIGDSTSTFGTFGPKFAPLGGRVHGFAARTSELRDHWVRLAHFIDVLRKSNRPLRQAIEEAGRRVKKFHPDGSDLTGFEMNVMRRLIPFYSWMRKATPLVLEGMAMRPHITLAFPRAMANLQAATGIESEGPSNPFPVDQMFPDWIKEKGIGPLLPPGNVLGRHNTWRGEAPGYTILNPTQPFMDQFIELGHPRQTAISALTPFVRVPIELGTGETALGIPLEYQPGGTAGHLASQIPAIGIGARVAGLTRPDEPYHPEQLMNWLITGGFITGTGPYENQARFEIREYLNEIGRRNRGR